MKITDISLTSIVETYSQGGVFYTKGYKSYFDSKRDKFICFYNDEKHEFNDITSLLLFLSFNDTSVYFIDNVASRYNWYVVNHDKVFGTFSSFSNSVSFCSKITADNRVNKTVKRMSKSVYLYIGPRHNARHFYIGLKDEMIKVGFKEIIGAYERKINGRKTT